MNRIRKAAILTAALLAAEAVAVPGGINGKEAYAQEVSLAASDALLKEQRLNMWYSQAISSINDGDYENALLCLDGCIATVTKEGNPELYADLYLKRGYCYSMTGRQEDAIEALETALETDPEMENAILLKVSAYSEMNDYPEAIKALEEYITLTGENSYYETMAALYEAEGETEKAFECYEKFAELTSENEGEAASMCGFYRMQRGQYEQAAALYGKSISSAEPADDAYYYRGLCYMSMGDYEAATADFESSVQAGETHADDALYTKATCEMTILDYENAVEDFGKCIDKEIDTADSRINRGICLLLSGKGEEALADLDACVEEDLNADEARFYRSYVYLAAKEYDLAIEDLTVCIENGYDLSSSYMQRAQVYKEMGDTDAWKADMEAAQKALSSEAEPSQEEEAVTEEALTEG